MNMDMSETLLTSPKRQVWNAGRTVGAKRALKPNGEGPNSQRWDFAAVPVGLVARQLLSEADVQRSP
jgi:hypothetical protein